LAAAGLPGEDEGTGKLGGSNEAGPIIPVSAILTTGGVLTVAGAGGATC
tara:strand:+ start:624 stop:770 length:147 start_codon:yes stop_codon:yes gene_type:complete